MSEEATKLEVKSEEPLVEDKEIVPSPAELDAKKDVLPAKSKSKAAQEEISGPLTYLILFSLPFGYMVSSLPGQYATHATFAMVTLFIICSLSTPQKTSRYTGLLFALVWTCAGVLFYNMRGI